MGKKQQKLVVPDPAVFYVSPGGTVKLGSLPRFSLVKDREARAEMIARAAPPQSCSPQILAVPGRGPMAPYRDVESYMTENGPRQRSTSSDYGLAARVAGPLEEIELASRGKRGSGPAFSAAHHVSANTYEALWHLVNGGQVKCSNLEGSGGGSGLSVTDEMLGSAQRLRWMDGAIGTGAVLSPEGWLAMPGRRTISAGLLVHWCLIRRKPLVGLLDAHGWARQSRYLKTLKLGLMASLDAIYGL